MSQMVDFTVLSMNWSNPNQVRSTWTRCEHPRLSLSLFSATRKRTGLTVWICCKPDGRRTCAAFLPQSTSLSRWDRNSRSGSYYLLIRFCGFVRLESFAITTICTIRRLVDANAAFDGCSAADPILRTRSALPSVRASGTRAKQACFHVLRSP